MYTMTVKQLCDINAGLSEPSDYSQLDTVLSPENVSKIFETVNYPIFDEGYRDTLNRAILEFFYFREIGFETVARWKMRLRVTLNGVMPYYNELYKTTQLEYNPLHDTDISRTHNTATTGATETQTQSVSDTTNNTDVNNVSSSSNTLTENNAHKDKRSDTSNTDTTQDITSDNQSVVVGSKSSSTSNTETLNDNLNGSTTQNKGFEDMYSDTPEGSVSNLRNGTYLTNARITNENLSTGTSSTQKQDKAITGNSNDNTQESKSDKQTSNTINNVNGTASSEFSSSDNKNTTSNENQSNDSKTQSTINNTSTDKTNQNINNVTQYVEHVMGKTGSASYSSLIREFRENLININYMIFNELEPLFMGLWE